MEDKNAGCLARRRWTETAQNIPFRLQAVLVAWMIAWSAFLLIAARIFIMLAIADAFAGSDSASTRETFQRLAALLTTFSMMGWVSTFVILNHWLTQVQATWLGKKCTQAKLLACCSLLTHSICASLQEPLHGGLYYTIGSSTFLVANIFSIYDLLKNKPAAAKYRLHYRIHANLPFLMMSTMTVGSAFFSAGTYTRYASKETGVGDTNVGEDAFTAANCFSIIGGTCFLIGGCTFGFWCDFFDIWTASKSTSAVPSPSGPESAAPKNTGSAGPEVKISTSGTERQHCTTSSASSAGGEQSRITSGGQSMSRRSSILQVNASIPDRISSRVFHSVEIVDDEDPERDKVGLDPQVEQVAGDSDEPRRKSTSKIRLRRTRIVVKAGDIEPHNAGKREIALLGPEDKTSSEEKDRVTAMVLNTVGHANHFDEQCIVTTLKKPHRECSFQVFDEALLLNIHEVAEHEHTHYLDDTAPLRGAEAATPAESVAVATTSEDKNRC
ncbi:unnamed protein product [Amoebophrya sp. A25]|nr:unnamed protein product [Amoebophrya sp. A25]|eukprot:GSA25T00018653001.1